MTRKAAGKFGKERPEDEPPQNALFDIEVDDDDGCVWIVIDGRTENLGPAEAVATKWADWLAERDFGG